MDALDRCIELLYEFKKTNDRDAGINALHMLDKFLNGILFSREAGHKKTKYNLSCVDCGADIIGTLKTKKICNTCANKRKGKVKRERKLNEININNAGIK